MTAAIVLCLVWLANRRSWRLFCERVAKARKLELVERYHTHSLVIVAVLSLGFSMAVAFYFVYRMNYVLEDSGLQLSEVNHSDLLHLQIQFLIGILSLMALVIIFLIFNRRYATYMNYEAKRDPLTGLANRRSFFQSCESAISGIEGGGRWFVMLDIDRFKQFNDRFGHPEGDLVLRAASQALLEVFDSRSIIGRVGGDEFAVLVLDATPRAMLEAKFASLVKRFHAIEQEGARVSCSIGAAQVEPGLNADELYLAADRLLYRAKAQGRDRFVIGETEAEGA